MRINMLSLSEAKNAEEWDYKGEGAANVIVLYCGTSPDFVGKVLRVKKAPIKFLKDSHLRNKAPVLSVEEQSIWSGWKEVVEANSKEILAQAYVQHVIGPLLGSQYVDPGTLIHVSEGFLEALEQKISNKRPAWRIEDAKIDTQSDFALLMSDHSLSLRGPSDTTPCISIEIKPKCGFLPSSRFISEENHIKRLVSRFAMHQHLKFSEQKISCISKYSPLDLFSESHDRIHRAIEGLFETPQNNLRIFLNGSLVFGGLGGYAEQELCDGPIVNSLARELEDTLENVIACQSGERVKFFKDLVTETLLRTRILSQLLEVQKMDMYDIEGAIHAYYNVIQVPCHVCTHSVSKAGNLNQAEKIEINPDEPIEKDMQEKISDLHFPYSTTESLSEEPMEKHTQGNFSYLYTPKNECSHLHSLSIEESRRIVRDYLLATTAKDCSLMLTFQPVAHYSTEVNALDGNDVIYLSSSKQAFRYKAKFIDLDLKHLKKMIHYYKLDQNIVNCYTRTHEGITLEN